MLDECRHGGGDESLGRAWRERDRLEHRGKIVDRHLFARELAQHVGEDRQRDRAWHDLANEDG